MHRMVRPSAIEFKRLASKRLLPRHDHPGRIHMSSASLARSAANVWITSSSSTSVTCAMCYRGIFNIITGPERISRSTRIVRSLAAYNQPLQARLSCSQRWAACIIATNVAPHDRRWSANRCARVGVTTRSIFHRCVQCHGPRKFHSFCTSHKLPCIHRHMNHFQQRSFSTQFRAQIHF